MLHFLQTLLIAGMSKGKHKRKREQAQRKAQQKARETGLLNSENISTEEADSTNARESDRDNKKEPSMRFRERLRVLLERSSLTDRIIAFFTFVLACAAIYQFVIMGNQLDTMRKDERPWLKIDFTLNTLQANQPIAGTIHVVNNGKTPARAITADMAIERVRNGELPRLTYPLPHPRFTTGLLFPNTPVDSAMTMCLGSA